MIRVKIREERTLAHCIRKIIGKIGKTGILHNRRARRSNLNALRNWPQRRREGTFMEGAKDESCPRGKIFRHHVKWPIKTRHIILANCKFKRGPLRAFICGLQRIKAQLLLSVLILGSGLRSFLILVSGCWYFLTLGIVKANPSYSYAGRYGKTLERHFPREGV